ncbi:MAG: RNA polymerase sigma factor RpoS, partial [Candidatus Omnitrophica bacterium]|nr:RNA polymerase sigma factor RpoS [Candidatus Omnitrophota bacterium]
MMDAIRSYLNKINTTPLLTPEGEIKLAKKVRRGDEKARKLMI